MMKSQLYLRPLKIAIVLTPIRPTVLFAGTKYPDACRSNMLSASRWQLGFLNPEVLNPNRPGTGSSPQHLRRQLAADDPLGVRRCLDHRFEVDAGADAH